MKIRNIVLQSLSALSIMLGVCNVAAEVAVQDTGCNPWSIIRIIDCEYGAPISNEIPEMFKDIRLRHFMKHNNFLEYFKYLYDQYKSHFPQGDAYYDLSLRSHFHLRMKEGLQYFRVFQINTDRDIRRYEKYKKLSFMALFIIPLTDLLCNFDLENSKSVTNLLKEGFKATVWCAGSISAYLFQEEYLIRVKYLKYQWEKINKLNQAYAYAFPGELRLSDQVGELILIDRLSS